MYILQYVCFINDIVKAWAEAKYMCSGNLLYHWVLEFGFCLIQMTYLRLQSNSPDQVHAFCDIQQVTKGK